MSDMAPRSYYDEFAEGEWERLDRDPVTQMEFENTVAYLDRHLPESGRVLDAGGAAGRYSIWLAERGYDVTLVDLSPKQVELAQKNAAERGLDAEISAETGDVRDLRFESDAFDAVCCLGGPLSHVVDDAERHRAMRELRRVAAPDAPVFVSVIGLLAALQDTIKFNADAGHGLLVPLAETGDYTAELVAERSDGEGWAECHFFRADGFERELQAAGFEVERLVGLEGVASRMKLELGEADEEAVESVRKVVRMLREDRAAVDWSEHMLAVCRA
ncbi:class I SAM-dependent methyltransferase [Haladaptatus halobius]|uniref:class I SAM-dependent methyltransferase n=1 Tax=Haladaptatus halobius TaxID=2884875 RepID=UPI001D0B70DA|nr:class I SAM-dependent methyltransferase [Haladaptatus halobius]